MTLALGIISNKGILLAADTRLSYENGSVQDAIKIFDIPLPSGRYIATHSSEDAFAAESLINEIRRKLEERPPDSFPAFETDIKNTLRQWYVYEHENRPRMDLLIVARIEREQCAKMYFCRPPNTVIAVEGNFRAIGEWTASDQIYKWFEAKDPKPLHECLCQASYIMHKTKELFPGNVGGETDVVVMGATDEPLWIERLSMKVAESNGGQAFDRNIGKMAALVMSGDAGGTQTILNMATCVYQSSLTYSRLEFRCRDSDKIIMHEFCT
jgi:20S proteasome alpha/beta subunit